MRLIWKNVKDEVLRTLHGYLVLDDPVLDKDSSFEIELVGRHNGNEHRVINGIGVMI
ncbi:MAG: hypothetical protein JXB30_15780 [Anaerolineae bacterium]|nr:hypothetical protein [Anaerolineae bacterium]